jgi:ankyrin repeat protein
VEVVVPNFLKINEEVLVGSFFPFLSPTEIPVLRLINRRFSRLGNSSLYWKSMLYRHFPFLARQAAAVGSAGVKDLYQLTYRAKFEGLSRVQAARFLAVYDSRHAPVDYRLPAVLQHLTHDDLLVMGAGGAVLADQVAMGCHMALYGHVFSLIRSYYASGPTLDSKKQDAIKRSLLHWLVIFAPYAFSLDDILARPETDISALDQFGHNAVYYAAAMANQSVLVVLLDHHADIDQTDPVHCQTALHQAVIVNNLSAVNLLYDYGADLCIRDKQGWCPVMYALKMGNFSVFSLLVSALKLDFNKATAAQDIFFIDDILGSLQDLFSKAVMTNQYQMAQVILNTRLIDINVLFQARNEVLISALHWVVAQGYFRFAQLLLSGGAAVNQVTSDGKTALYCAAESGSYLMTDLLLKNGASVLSARGDGATALFVAVRRQAGAVVERLLLAKSNPNVTLDCGTTALHQACVQCNYVSAALLLRYGAKVNAEQAFGVTPLHTAARVGFPRLLKLLLRHGADIEAKQGDGATPLVCAIQSRQPRAIHFLLSHFANPNVALDNGLTANDLIGRLNLQEVWRFGLQRQQHERLKRQDAANQLLRIGRGGELFRPFEKRNGGRSAQSRMAKQARR